MGNCNWSSDKNGFLEALEDISSLPPISEMLEDFKGETFLDDFERLAASLLEEVEHVGSGATSESVLEEVSDSDRKTCITDFEMVGTPSELMEPSKSSEDISHSKCNFKVTDLTVEDQICLIASEHSYSHLSASVNENICMSQPSTTEFTTIPEITISQSESMDISESDAATSLMQKDDHITLVPLPNFCSPKSDASSDLGYESHGSPYESELSSSFGDFFGDSLSELFPELI